MLHRCRNAEYWDGTLQGRPAIIKRFPDSREAHWREFILQSRISHSALLSATEAGVTSGDHFAYCMPVSFAPRRITTIPDPGLFAAQILSLAAALRSKGFCFRWDGLLVQDPGSGRVFLPGINILRWRPDAETRTLAQLREIVCENGHDCDIDGILRKWERRKDQRLDGCLHEMMQHAAASPSIIPARFEIPRTQELELIGGLLQLVRQSRGRAVLFQSDPGGGKSSLLAQIYKDLLLRDVDLVFHQAPRESRPFRSIRRFLDIFFEQCGAYQSHHSEFSAGRWNRPGQDLLAVPEEALVADLLRLIERRHAETERSCVFLVDDLDGFDPQSLSVIARLVRGMESSSVLFVATCTRRLENMPEALVTLPVETLPENAFEQSCILPLWKSDQRSSTVRSVYRQTSGNPLLFHEAFLQTLRRSEKGLRWDEGEWMLTDVQAPSIPASVASLYLKRLPELSVNESRFLEAAAVQGCAFDPALLNVEEPLRATILTSLREKGILMQSQESWRFVLPVFADLFYERLEDSQRRSLHLQVAEKLSAESSGSRHAEIARHFLRGGQFAEALKHACLASAEIRFNTAQIVLPILEELQIKSTDLEESHRLLLLREKAQLLFRKGKYPAAAEAFEQALQLVPEDGEEKFDLQVRIAESSFLNNDIHGALLALRDVEQKAASIRNSKLLVRFYLCRGMCGWHRGRRDKKDFEEALSLADEQQDYESLAYGYRLLAELEYRSGTLTTARAMAARALKFARKTPSHLECGHAFRILGMIAWHRSLHHTAGRIFQRSIRHFSRAGSMDGVARVWTLLGNVHVEQYRFQEATSAFQKASALFGQLDHPLEVSLAQFNLGLVYIEQAKLQEAEKIYQRCRIMDRKTGNKRYYAYDLRALAVVAVLRGFHRKASDLLNKTLEICEELQAEGDILQTQMIRLMNELEQKNYRQARPLAELLRDKLESVQEPMAQAEIHYLLGHYHGYINETEKAQENLDEALRLARKIRYYKLIGMSLILKLVFRNTAPQRKDRDLRRAISCFHRSQNELRLADYLLKLYQAYPALLKEREHALRLAKMEKLYRHLRHRPKHKLVRQLAMSQAQRPSDSEPMYDWWHSLLKVMHGEGDLETRIQGALALLTEEMRASTAGLWFKDAAWIRVEYPKDPKVDGGTDFYETIWKRVAAKKEALCVELSEESELAESSWARLNDIRSLMAVPVAQEGKVLGMWYYERRGMDSPFTRKDLGKAAFSAMATLPAILNALQDGVVATIDDGPVPRIDVDFVGKGPAMQSLQRQIARLAPLDISVLILGESGTGKELIARSLHRNSPRASAPFVALNCSAIPESLVESELFGHAKGAFTGASMTKQGSIERANGGTLFLDEIGDLSLAAQAKLLRVMQEKEIQRLGETTPRKMDVRFLFATHKDLKKMVRDGAYREDLFYRISVYSLQVLPLRERPEDIPLLLSHLTEKYSRSFSRGRVQYAPAALQALCEYSWPGNVREMENAVQTLLVNADSGGRIDLKDLPAQIRSGASFRASSGMSLESARQEFEREFLKQALSRNAWNKTQTARELGITRQGLIQMIQRLGIENS